MRLVIVKRGQFSTFRMLRRQFADVPDVRVIWDRRERTDRRIVIRPMVPERRRQERRTQPPPSWTELKYLVVKVAGADSAPM